VANIFRGGTLIDGTGAPPHTADVAIDGGRFTAVGIGQGATSGDSIDVSGLTLLPGLIDAHTHLGVAVAPPLIAVEGSVSIAELSARIFENLGLALDAGFTTVRELLGVDGGIRAPIDQGLVRGPRVFPSGPALSQDGGHGTLMPAYACCTCPVSVPGLFQATAVCTGVDEVRLAARRAFRAGATQLKVMVTGGVVSMSDDFSDTQFSVEELRAAVEEATARGTYVTAHAVNNRGIRNGLAAGIQCFEHGAYLDEETAAAMKAAGADLVPTLAVARLMRDDPASLGLPAAIAARVADVEAGMRTAIRVALAAGLRVGSGADLLGSRQNRHGLEIALKSEVMGPLAAIHSATGVNAQIMRIDDRLGTVQEGKIADLIAVDGDPIEDPWIFDDPDRVVLVVKAGVVVKNTQERVRVPAALA
jgi:imidazolonepropionase-like amidohydrolase